jgi:hypothetical protein
MRRAAKDGRDEKLELWELHGSKITLPDIGWAGLFPSLQPDCSGIGIPLQRKTKIIRI